jgi:hypothetical protein
MTIKFKTFLLPFVLLPGLMYLTVAIQIDLLYFYKYPDVQPLYFYDLYGPTTNSPYTYSTYILGVPPLVASENTPLLS